MIVGTPSYRRTLLVSATAFLAFATFGCKSSTPAAPSASAPVAATPATRQPVTPPPTVNKHLYSAEANPKADIATALKQASLEHKRVILSFGGDWCGDCQVLDIYLHQSPNLELLDNNFLLVHVDIGHFDKNLDITEKYNVPLKKGVPALAVIDADGKLLYAQQAAEFGDMRYMYPTSVTDFLNKWKANLAYIPLPWGDPMRRLLRLPRILHGTLLRAARHDCLNLAQSTAYSAMVSLFPALIVAAAVVSLLPDTAPLRFQLSAFFDRILPPDVSPLLQSYFVDSPHSTRSTHALIIAFLVSLTGASSVIATLMEGVRRANELPIDCWTFWQRRLRAFLLVPLSLLPFALATVLIVFGQFITEWLALHILPFARTPIYAVALLIRWGVALTGCVGIIGLIYHMGTPIRQSWKRTLPGATLSTAMWFLITLVFGWYVTRFANYSQVYGSLGAGIALLFWLYIISLCILCGAEFNAEFHARFSPSRHTHSAPAAPNV